MCPSFGPLWLFPSRYQRRGRSMFAVCVLEKPFDFERLIFDNAARVSVTLDTRIWIGLSTPLFMLHYRWWSSLSLGPTSGELWHTVQYLLRYSHMCMDSSRQDVDGSRDRKRALLYSEGAEKCNWVKADVSWKLTFTLKCKPLINQLTRAHSTPVCSV